jgi:RNA polymerase sigma-70 factor (ECF subfamily)
VGDLVERLLQQVGAARAERLLRVDGLEAALLALVQAARVAWPALEVEPVEFLGYVVERLPSDADLAAALASLHAPDLYLAYACARGDEQALAILEHHFLSEVGSYLSRGDALSDFTQEVKQVLRHRLLVAPHGVLPKIGSYTGRGSLKTWLRIAMTRTAIDLRRRAAPTAPADDALPAPRASANDPELAYLKEHYRRELGHAMRATLALLSDRESNVLWLRYYQGMSAEAIGATYHVSARTVQRWLDLARDRVLSETHKLLAERLKVEPSEIRHMIHLAHSQLELSFTRLLRRSV